MKKKAKLTRREQIYLWFAGGFLLLSAAIWLLSANLPAISRFFRMISRALAAGLGAVFSIASFPFSELFLIFVPAALIIYLIVRCVRGHFRGCCSALITLCFWLTLIIFVFTVTLGVNYTAPSVAGALNLTVSDYSTDTLCEVTEWAAQQLNQSAQQAPRDADGELIRPAFGEQVDQVLRAYQDLSQNYPYFKGTIATPKKAVLLPDLMSYVGVAGYYFPFTTEPIVNANMVTSHLPYHIAHEAAHAFGVPLEDEANFVAFLACTSSDSPLLCYSGYFNGFILAYNALYKIDSSRALAIMEKINEDSRQDFQRLHEYLAQYDTPIRDVGEKINDAYIKGTGQPAGIQSYGKMVDLLISYYLTIAQ